MADRRIKNILLYAVILVFALLWITPVVWSWVASTRPISQPMGRGGRCWSGHGTFPWRQVPKKALSSLAPGWERVFNFFNHQIGSLGLPIGLLWEVNRVWN